MSVTQTCKEGAKDVRELATTETFGGNTIRQFTKRELKGDSAAKGRERIGVYGLDQTVEIGDVLPQVPARDANWLIRVSHGILLPTRR